MWTTRPPQHHFDGSDARRAINARYEAEIDADHNHPYWQARAEHYAGLCQRKMGAEQFEQFMAAYPAATFEAHTWRDLTFALMGLQHELRFQPSEAVMRRAFGWPVEVQ